MLVFERMPVYILYELLTPLVTSAADFYPRSFIQNSIQFTQYIPLDKNIIY